MAPAFFPPRRTSHGLYSLTALIVIALCTAVMAVTYPPRPASPVADYANVIDNATESQITLIAQALYEQAGFSLIVATIPDLGEEVIDQYAPELYKQWGIGKKGVDEGALVLLSLKPRKVRIEVGLGSEGYLNDAATGRILDAYGVPYFRQDNFGEGLKAISGAIAQIVAREKNITLTMPGSTAMQSSATAVKVSPFMILVMLALFILMISTPFGRAILWGIILSSLLGGGSSHRGGGGFGGGFGGGGFGGGSSGGGGASRGF